MEFESYPHDMTNGRTTGDGHGAMKMGPSFDRLPPRMRDIAEKVYWSPISRWALLGLGVALGAFLVVRAARR
jgi:hypothetical protein